MFVPNRFGPVSMLSFKLPLATQGLSGGCDMLRSRLKRFVFLLGALIGAPSVAAADEGGVSFWIPGFFVSLAVAPQQPGWSLTDIGYQTSVSADAGVAIARERELGHLP